MTLFGASLRRSPWRATARSRHAAHPGSGSDRARNLPCAPDRDGPRARVRGGRPPAQRGRGAAQLRRRGRAVRPRRAEPPGRGRPPRRPRRGAVPRAGRARPALRARARRRRSRRHRRRRDRGRRQRARAAAPRRDDRAPADRARGAPLYGLVRRRGHLPRDLSEPERPPPAGRHRGRRERRELDGCGPSGRSGRLHGVHGVADDRRSGLASSTACAGPTASRAGCASARRASACPAARWR